MNSNLKKKCLSFICSASLVTGLTVSPAGSVFGYTAGFTVYAEGEAEGETIKTEAMGIFLTLLLGSGFRMVGSFADQAQALGQQFDQWVAETQATITAGTIVAGTMFQKGWMKLSSDVANAYNGFATWLTDTLAIPTTGTVDVPLTGTVAGSYYQYAVGECLMSDPSATFRYNYQFSEPVRLVTLHNVGNYYRSYAFYTETFKYGYNTNAACPVGTLSNNPTGTITADDTTYYYRTLSGNSYELPQGIPDILVESHEVTPNVALQYTYGEATLAPDDQILTGESLDLKDGIGLDQDQALLYDISALAEYAGVLDQTLTDANDLVGVLTDAIARSKAEADEEEDEDAEVIPWDLVDSDTDSKVAPDDITDVPPNDTGMYKTLGLEKIFPFSIPFDIYYFIKMFNAPAQPLEFDIPFVVTGVINQNYHVDLSIFNPVAQIFRLMMLVGFIWFLITKTRDFLRS